MANQGNFFALLDGEEGDDLTSLLERVKAEKKKKAEEEARQQQQQLARDQQSSPAGNSRFVSDNRRLTKGGEKDRRPVASGKNEGTGRQPNGNQQFRRGHSNNGYQHNGFQRENGYQRNNGPANGYPGDSYNENYRRKNANWQANRQADGQDNRNNGDVNDKGRFNRFRQGERRGYGGRGRGFVGRGQVYRENQGVEKDQGEDQVDHPNVHLNGNESREKNAGHNSGGDGTSDGGNHHPSEQSDVSVTSEGSKGPKAEAERMSFWKRLEVMNEESREAFFKKKAEEAKERSFWSNLVKQKRTPEERRKYCTERVQEEEAEEKKMTLKEYEEMHAEKRKAQEVEAALKMEERRRVVDVEYWEKLEKIGKNKDVNGVKVDENKKKQPCDHNNNNKEEKVNKSLKINEFQFQGKYASGDGRESVGMGGRKDVKKSAMEIKIDDQKQFPSLKC